MTDVVSASLRPPVLETFLGEVVELHVSRRRVLYQEVQDHAADKFDRPRLELGERVWLVLGCVVHPF